MHALEFLDDHGLSHSALSIEEKTRHPGAGRVLEFLQAIERPSGPGVANPIGSPNLPDPIAGAIKGAFSDADRQMGEVQVIGESSAGQARPATRVPLLSSRRPTRWVTSWAYRAFARGSIPPVGHERGEWRESH